MSGGGHRCERHDEQRDSRECRDDHPAHVRKLSRRVACLTVTQKSVRNDEKRKASMPEHVEPCRCLFFCPEQPNRRECTREGQRMRNNDQSVEKVSRCQHKYCRGPQTNTLVEQQSRGDQVNKDQCRFIAGDEGREFGQWHTNKRNKNDKKEERSARDSQGETLFAARSNRRPQENATLIEVHQKS